MIVVQANPHSSNVGKALCPGHALQILVSPTPEIEFERLLAAFSMKKSSITQAQAFMLHAATSLSSSCTGAGFIESMPSSCLGVGYSTATRTQLSISGKASTLTKTGPLQAQ